MQNPVAFQVHYDDYKRQMAWVNDAGWQFTHQQGQPTRVRRAVARALIHLAAALAPTPAAPQGA